MRRRTTRLAVGLLAAASVSPALVGVGTAGAATPSPSATATGPLAAVGPSATATPGASASPDEFVRRVGADLRLGDKPFRFAGSNNYYVFYTSRKMTDAVFDKARDSGLTVMRVWASQEVQNPDGSGSVDTPDGPVWFQHWDAAAGRPVVKEGPDGIERLDYVVWKAKQNGIRLVMPLVNNWNNFGGMDQYVRWAGGASHDDFYTNPKIKGWYKDWITYLLNRTNPLTGLRYKDDPTIMTWELGNEPRCLSAGAYPRSQSCTTRTLVDWATEVSAHIKSIDGRHLTSVGDEGFYAKDADSEDWTRTGGEGVDSIALTSIDTIDVMSLHLYPGSWGKDSAWSVRFLKEHLKDARRLGKPVVLGEFGWPGKADRNAVYRKWLDVWLTGGGAGALYWILSDVQDDGTPYPDYDGFTVYCPGPVCTTISNFAAQMRFSRVAFPPVADHDTVVTAFNIPATHTVTANDTAYNSARIVPGTVDLDPALEGRQATLTGDEGTVVAADDGSVTFTPKPGFVGRRVLGYVVRDSMRRLSDVATLTFIVKPDPGAAITLFSFEQDTQNWVVTGDGASGTVTQTAEFSTDGTKGLAVDSGGGWFGRDFDAPVDLSAKSTIRIDMKTGPVGTSTQVALKTGDSWAWCDGGGWRWTPQETTTTVELDLVTGLTCSGVDLGAVRGLYVYVNKGTHMIDNIRAE